jgi:hypothetical protein
MLTGSGPAPSWFVSLQVAAQIMDEAKANGYEIEWKDPADSIKDPNELDE